MMDIKQHFKSSVMNHEVKVELKDQRVVYGRLTCIDKHKNLVVQESIMQVQHQYIAQVNDSLKFLIQKDNYAERFISNNQQDSTFSKDKHFIGNIVIPGDQIHKFYVREQKPLSQSQLQQQQQQQLEQQQQEQEQL